MKPKNTFFPQKFHLDHIRSAYGCWLMRACIKLHSNKNERKCGIDVSNVKRYWDFHQWFPVGPSKMSQFRSVRCLGWCLMHNTLDSTAVITELKLQTWPCVNLICICVRIYFSLFLCVCCLFPRNKFWNPRANDDCLMVFFFSLSSMGRVVCDVRVCVTLVHKWLSNKKVCEKCHSLGYEIGSKYNRNIGKSMSIKQLGII